MKSSLFNRILTLGAAVSYYESDNKQIEGKELDPEFRLLNACSKTPATAETNRLVNLMRERGVLISRIGTHDNILKTRPPMPFSRRHADRAMKTTEGYPMNGIAAAESEGFLKEIHALALVALRGWIS